MAEKQEKTIPFHLREYVPTGRPRGRPSGPTIKKRGAHLRVPDHLKVPKKAYVPTGRPRGRQPGEGLKPEHLKKAKKVPSGKPRGRPKKTE